MTDKQVIADGCDVAGCEYLGLYKECKLKCGSCCPVDCSDNPNCHYKLHKRKEQECEELKKQVNDLLNKPEIQDKILWKIDNEAVLGSKDAWIYKLEQTLTEIKEIAEEQIPYLNIDKAKTMIEIEYDYAGKIYNLEQRMYKILQKISEVKND